MTEEVKAAARRVMFLMNLVDFPGNNYLYVIIVS